MHLQEQFCFVCLISGVYFIYLIVVRIAQFQTPAQTWSFQKNHPCPVSFSVLLSLIYDYLSGRCTLRIFETRPPEDIVLHFLFCFVLFVSSILLSWLALLVLHLSVCVFVCSISNPFHSSTYRALILKHSQTRH